MLASCSVIYASWIIYIVEESNISNTREECPQRYHKYHMWLAIRHEIHRQNVLEILGTKIIGMQQKKKLGHNEYIHVAKVSTLLGVRKIGGNPRTQELRDSTRNSRKTARQRISKSLLLPQKLWTPLHVPVRPLL
jgi:hypothetical protein